MQRSCWNLSLQQQVNVLFAINSTGVFYDYRTPFMLSDKPELLEAALTLLKEAESESIRPIDGSIRASTVR